MSRGYINSDRGDMVFKPTEGYDKELYIDFILRARKNFIGRSVKIADLKDNLSPMRMNHLPPDQRGITKRYERAMKLLTCAPGDKNYEDYAGRGIKFLFKNFDQFYAELGVKPAPELLLDRINNDGNYEPGNVRWATPHKSNENKRLTKKCVVHLAKISSLGGAAAQHSGQAATIAHIRWHVNRGIKKEDCVLCQIQQ